MLKPFHYRELRTKKFYRNTRKQIDSFSPDGNVFITKRLNEFFSSICVNIYDPRQYNKKNRKANLMPYLIALATSDRKTIHQHFGKTKTFAIFSVDNNGYAYLETRNVEPCCNNHTHHENAFEQIFEILHDCQAIVAGKIGSGAADYFMSKGIYVFETIGYIDDVLNEFSRNLSRYFPKNKK